MLSKTLRPAVYSAAALCATFLLAGCNKPSTPPAANSPVKPTADLPAVKTPVTETSNLPKVPAIDNTKPVAGTPGNGSPLGASGDETALAAAPPIDASKVPDADVPTLLQHIQQLRLMQPRGSSPEEEATHEKQIKAGIVATADKILAEKNLEPGDRLRAINLKWQALGEMMIAKYPDAREQLIKFTETLIDDPEPQLSLQAQDTLLNLRLMAAQEGQPANFKVIAAKIAGGLKAQPDMRYLQFALQAAMQMEASGAVDDAKEIYTAMVKAGEALGDEQITSMAQGGLKRAALLGTKPMLEGRLLGGEKFDWAKYRGKIVLIDFWATWCGPCVKELPNVKKAYEEFHGKGFDVVGISLDDDLATLSAFLEQEKLPWVTVLGKVEGMPNSPLSDAFAVNSIPATFLVDKEGKIVSISARGAKLEEQLKKLLGDAPAKP